MGPQKVSSYWHSNYFYEDETILQASYLCNGIPLPGKTVFILKQGPGPMRLAWRKITASRLGHG